jgi:tricorn protease-like protein
LKNRKQSDEENFKALMNCYSKFGSFSTIKISGDAFNAYYMILLHNFLNISLYKKYDDFFIKEIHRGNLDAREYVRIVDNYRYDSTQVYGDHTIFFTGDSLFVYQLSETAAKRINSNRSRIYLQDMETTQQKLIWQWKQGDVCTFGCIWEFETEESAIRL